jgi:hypothetical protein
MRMIKIPKILHELHGELAPAYALWIVYLGGTLAAALFVLLLLYTTSGIESWKLLISAVLMLDIAGGVIANLSRSTNEYYHDPGKARLRAAFLILHIAQPTLFALMFPEAVGYFAVVLFWTLPAAYGVTRILDQETATHVASLLVTLGVLVSTGVGVLLYQGALPPPGGTAAGIGSAAAGGGPVQAFPLALTVIGPLFMVKLILGFAVDRSGSTDATGEADHTDR